MATGKTFTVRNFVETAIKAAGLLGEVEDYVDYDPSIMRPTEVNLLVGDAAKATEILGWEPSTNFENLVDIMVQNDLKIEAIRH